MTTGPLIEDEDGAPYQNLFMVLAESPDNRSLTMFDITEDAKFARRLAKERSALVVAVPIVADFRR